MGELGLAEPLKHQKGRKQGWVGIGVTYGWYWHGSSEAQHYFPF